MDVLIASGQPNLRFSLEVFLRQQAGIMVTGTVSRAESLLAIIRAAPPDLVIMDWDLPGRAPGSVLAEVKATEGSPHIIVLGKDANVLQTALDAGASEALTLGEYPADLLAAIRRLESGRQASDQNEEEAQR